MKVALLSANLGSFDTPSLHVEQFLPLNVILDEHVFTDANFPPITGLTPRLQYRIPKLFGWEMFPDYDVYIWLDASMSLQSASSVEWLLQQLGRNDMAFFRHPWRKTIREEVSHIEQKLQENNTYIVSRYENGLHKEQLAMIQEDTEFTDDKLYASTVFVYRNTEQVQEALQLWWYYQSRYFTCDQVALPYALHEVGVKVAMIKENLFKIPYLSLTSHHK